MSTNTFEGGTNGQLLTVANSGGANGTAFSHVVSNNANVGVGSANIIYSDGVVGHGTMAAKLVLTAAVSYLRLICDQTGANARYVARRMIYLESTPTANLLVLTILSGLAGSDIFMGSIQIGSDQKIRPFRNTTYVAAGLSATTLALGTIYFIEMAIVPETGGGANGIFAWQLSNAAGTVLETYTSPTTQVITTNNVNFTARACGAANTVGVLNDYVDDFSIVALASGWIGAPANIAPTVTVGATQNVAASATVNVTSIATDPDGTIVSRLWSFDYPTTSPPAYTNGTSANASFTAGAAGSLYLPKHTATDNASSAVSASTEVRVPSAAASLRHTGPDIAGVGTWVKTGGTVTAAILTDESDGSYEESPTVTVTETTKRSRLQPSASRTTLVLSERLATDTGTATVKVRLFEGTTMRQEWTQGITTTVTDYPFTVTTPSAISDWGNLYVEIAGTT